MLQAHTHTLTKERVNCLLTVLLVATLLVSTQLFASDKLRVGVYQNAPSVFYDKSGKVQGFYIDVLEHIANLEDWTLVYYKATWPELIKQLDSGGINMIAGMAFSAERDRKYDFTTEPVFINWGQVYVRDTSIQSLLDLTNRRVVGLKADIYTLQFQHLLDQFALPVQFIEVSSYQDVMVYVESGRADAGITSRSNGQQLEGQFKVHRSPIVCCSREVHYAMLENNGGEWLRSIDHNLQELKSNNDSVYFASLDRWFAETQDEIIPQWLLWALVIAFSGAVVLAVLSIILRRQVREKTTTLQESYGLLEKRVQ